MTYPRVVLVAGGTSAERAVSLATGDAMEAALRRLPLDVMRMDFDDAFVAQIHALRPDVVVLGLHGGHGENGAIQGLLEVLGIPYTGSGVAASALAMDKAMTKRLLAGAGLPSPRWWPVSDPTMPWPSGDGPVALKPVADGSSVGVHRVEGSEEWPTALNQALASGGRWMAEEWVTGRELSVALMEGEVLGTVEIQVSQGWYDYAAKYERQDTTYLIPAPLNEEEAATVEDVARRTWDVMGCRGLGRVDVLLDDAGAWVLEVNTLPGMTRTSLVPKLATLRGWDFERLMRELLRTARTDAGQRFDGLGAA